MYSVSLKATTRQVVFRYTIKNHHSNQNVTLESVHLIHKMVGQEGGMKSMRQKEITEQTGRCRSKHIHNTAQIKIN